MLTGLFRSQKMRGRVENLCQISTKKIKSPKIRGITPLSELENDEYQRLRLLWVRNFYSNIWIFLVNDVCLSYDELQQRIN
jgi:hypothetical protein